VIGIEEPPQLGRQKVQILDQGHVLVHAMSETIVAEKGEDAAALVRRLVAQRGWATAVSIPCRPSSAARKACGTRLAGKGSLDHERPTRLEPVRPSPH
jgi:hypothetical protein